MRPADTSRSDSAEAFSFGLVGEFTQGDGTAKTWSIANEPTCIAQPFSNNGSALSTLKKQVDFVALSLLPSSYVQFFVAHCTQLAHNTFVVGRDHS